MKKSGHVKVLIFLLSYILLSILHGCIDNHLGIDDYVPHEAEPQLISIPTPEYPLLARLLRQEGVVFVKMLVDVNGKVTHAVIIESSGYWLLDNAALDAARGALFKPAMNDGEPVCVWVGMPFRFQLEN